MRLCRRNAASYVRPERCVSRRRSDAPHCRPPASSPGRPDRIGVSQGHSAGRPEFFYKYSVLSIELTKPRRAYEHHRFRHLAQRRRSASLATFLIDPPRLHREDVGRRFVSLGRPRCGAERDLPAHRVGNLQAESAAGSAGDGLLVVFVVDDIDTEYADCRARGADRHAIEPRSGASATSRRPIRTASSCTRPVGVPTR